MSQYYLTFLLSLMRCSIVFGLFLPASSPYGKLVKIFSWWWVLVFLVTVRVVKVMLKYSIIERRNLHSITFSTCNVNLSYLLCM